MDRKRVCDVIGNPESWPNQLNGEGPTDFRGAKISDVFTAGNIVVVCTSGGACGLTFSAIPVADKDMCDRLAQVLRLGLDVHEAAAAEI